MSINVPKVGPLPGAAEECGQPGRGRGCGDGWCLVEGPCTPFLLFGPCWHPEQPLVTSPRWPGCPRGRRRAREGLVAKGVSVLLPI